MLLRQQLSWPCRPKAQVVQNQSWSCTNAIKRSAPACRAGPNSPKTSQPSNDGDLSELLQELARQRGVRVMFEAGDEDEEDLESWEDALEELEDPWMRNPAVAEEKSLDGFLSASASALMDAADQEEAGSEAASVAAGGTAAVGDAAGSAAPGSTVSGSTVSAYQDPSVMASVSYAELEQMVLGPSGVPHVLLDVRSELEYRIGHIPGSVNVPLESLNAQSAATLFSGTPSSTSGAMPNPASNSPPAVVVVGSGDHRSQQACVRLVRVHKVGSQVSHYAGGIGDWSMNGGQLQKGGQ